MIHHGHFEGDAQTYRAPRRPEDNRANKDCLKKFAAAVADAGNHHRRGTAQIYSRGVRLIERAVARQRQRRCRPPPT